MPCPFLETSNRKASVLYRTKAKAAAYEPPKHTIICLPCNGGIRQLLVRSCEKLTTQSRLSGTANSEVIFGGSPTGTRPPTIRRLAVPFLHTALLSSSTPFYMRYYYSLKGPFRQGFFNWGSGYVQSGTWYPYEIPLSPTNSSCLLCCYPSGRSPLPARTCAKRDYQRHPDHAKSGQHCLSSAHTPFSTHPSRPFTCASIASLDRGLNSACPLSDIADRSASQPGHSPTRIPTRSNKSLPRSFPSLASSGTSSLSQDPRHSTPSGSST